MSFGKPTEVQAIKYAESFVLYGDKTKAIRAAFPESKAVPASLSNKATEFHKLVEVQGMIELLHKSITGEAEEEALYTARQAIDELDEARKLAKGSKGDKNGEGACLASPSAMIQASMGKAKIAGLLVDRIDQKLKGDVNLQVKEWTVKVVD
jgi:phage terminase small subunit